jgi:MarR family transcriptional regulator, 2-MHQ and catechol-resistance regulon repressor
MSPENTTNETDLSLKLLIVLSRANRAVFDRVTEDMRSHGLNPTEFAVLELLYHKGDQPIQHIGKKVLLASGSITYVVDKLEGKELLERKACPKDRRVTHAVITEKGKKLMAEIFPKHKKAIQEIFKGLDSEEKGIMIALLKKLGLHAQDMR